MKKSLLLFIILSFSIYALPASETTSQTLTENRLLGWDTYPTLPSESIDSHFNKVSTDVRNRCKNNPFLKLPEWSPQRDSEEILHEFYDINTWRLNAWFKDQTCVPCESNPDFIIAQELLRSGNYRYSNCIAFEYNLTDPSYNSSSITYKNHRFLALEGPMESNVARFLHLIINFRVKHLVRLTRANEGSMIKCFPYLLLILF